MPTIRFWLFVLAWTFVSPSWAVPPNILFLMSDDHSYPYLGAYGNRDVRTPTIDLLAAQGMRFDAMFVTSPSCVPSRASLMAGRSPVALRMGRFRQPLSAEHPALPDLLREKAGYFTGLGGRDYHLDGPATNGSVVPGILDRHQLRTFRSRVDHIAPPLGPRDTLISFLDRVPPGKPWFFWQGFGDPHYPWTQTGPRGVPDPAGLTVPGHLPDLPGVRGDLARYIAEVERLDTHVQAVLNLLAQRGLLNNTIVVFMGDNGMAMPHGKGALHDPGIHVPLIVRWPGVVLPGTVASELVSGEDFAPTMLEAAGVTPPKEMSGISYLKLLQGYGFEGRKHIFAQRVVHGGDGSNVPDPPIYEFDMARCVRSANFKLIYNRTPHHPVEPLDSRTDPGWQETKAAFAEGRLAPAFVRAYFTVPRPLYELYDLKADPSELVNLADRPEYSTILRELQLALTEKMVLDWDFLPTPLN